jgi:hypothetical protein
MAVAFVLFIVLVAAGSVFFGRDSRIDEAARRRRYLG